MDHGTSEHPLEIERWFLIPGSKKPLSERPVHRTQVRCLQCDATFAWPAPEEEEWAHCLHCGAPFWTLLRPAGRPTHPTRTRWMSWCAWLADRGQTDTADEMYFIGLHQWSAIHPKSEHFQKLQQAIEAALDSENATKEQATHPHMFLPDPGAFAGGDLYSPPLRVPLQIRNPADPMSPLHEASGVLLEHGYALITMSTPLLSWMVYRIRGLQISKADLGEGVSLRISDFRIAGGANLTFTEDPPYHLFYQRDLDRLEPLRGYPIVLSPNSASLTLRLQGPPGAPYAITAEVVAELVRDDAYSTPEDVLGGYPFVLPADTAFAVEPDPDRPSMPIRLAHPFEGIETSPADAWSADHGEPLEEDETPPIDEEEDLVEDDEQV